jgi:hypothetical protein
LAIAKAREYHKIGTQLAVALGGTEAKTHGHDHGKRFALCLNSTVILTDWRISSFSSDGRNASERVHNRWIADVATMNDEVRVAKRIKPFSPNQTVGI